MPTILTHALIPATLAVVAGPRLIAPRVAVVGALLAMLPDADVISFHFGIAYAAPWGHRGAAHSLAIAALVTACITLLWRDARQWKHALFLFISMASHGLLDTLTNGGLGVALYWPFETLRHFAPWRPILVSPIGIGFFSARGVATLLSELRWVWLPCACLMLAAVAWRRGHRARHGTAIGADGFFRRKMRSDPNGDRAG